MRRNKLFFSIAILLICFIFLPCLKAQTEAYVSTSALRVREKPTTDSNTLLKIYSGETITIIDENKVSGTGCNDGWYKIEKNSIQGYVCSTYIKLGSINTSYNTADFNARVYANSVSVRSYASSSASKVTNLLNGTNLTILDTLSSGNGCNDSWYKVNFHNNRIGYVCGTYVIKQNRFMFRFTKAKLAVILPVMMFH